MHSWEHKQFSCLALEEDKVPVERQVFLVLLVIKDLVVSPVSLDHKEPQDLVDSLAPREVLVQREMRVPPEKLVHSDQSDNQESPDVPVPQVCQDLKATVVSADKQV